MVMFLRKIFQYHQKDSQFYDELVKSHQ